MNRKIKTLALAIVATLALTAVMASAAQANFTSSAAHTGVFGEQVQAHKFTAGVGIAAISCTVAEFTGTATSASVSILTIKPTYAVCKDSLNRKVHVMRNTVEYHLLSTVSKGQALLTGEIELTVTTAGFGHCTISINGPQTINGITYTQQGNDLLLSTHTNNITSTISGGGFACGTSASHSSTGTYTGTTLMKGNGGAAKISAH